MAAFRCAMTELKPISPTYDYAPLSASADDARGEITEEAPVAKPTWVQKCKKAWNPKTNLKSLLFPQVGEGQMQVLDGIRGFAMCWVILVHSWQVLAWDKYADPEFKRLQESWVMRFIRAGELSVDMFFVLSGFLIAHIMIREHEKTGKVSLVQFFVRRVLRIVPVYFFILFFYWPIFTAIGCPNCGGCNTYGWSNLLFINNFVPMFGSCMAWTWSIAVEVQYYVFSPFLMWVFNRSKKWGFTLLILLHIGALIVRFWVIYDNDLYLPNSDIGRYMDIVYIKPYTRVSPYLIGMTLAGIWAVWRAEMKNWKPSQKQNALLTVLEVIAIAMMVLIVVFSAGYQGHTLATWFTYMWLERAVWGLSTAIIVFVSLLAPSVTSGFSSWRQWPFFCYFAMAVKWFMSLRIWYISAQLSYSMYLLHPLWIVGIYYAWIIYNPVTFGYYIFYCVMNLCVSFAMALGMWLLVEKPFMLLRE